VTCQTTQYQLYSELVEGSSWARGPDKNLIYYRIIYYVCKKDVGRWHLVIA